MQDFISSTVVIPTIESLDLDRYINTVKVLRLLRTLGACLSKTLQCSWVYGLGAWGYGFMFRASDRCSNNFVLWV